MPNTERFQVLLAEALLRDDRLQVEIAEELGVSAGMVTHWKQGTATPSPDTVFRLEGILHLKPGHLSRALGYLPAGELDASEPAGVEEALNDDPWLHPADRKALLQLYQSVRKAYQDA